jgi:hypothetical protein
MADGMLRPPDVKLESDLRKEFTKVTGDFQEVDSAFKRVKASLPTAAGDIALLIGFMKILDPGSVVREGEFATAENAQSVPDRVRNTYNKLLTGERLLDDQRRAFLDQADGLYRTAVGKYQQQAEYYQGIAKAYQLNPDRVAPSLPGAQQEPARQPQQRPMPRAGSPGVVLDRFPPAGRGAPGPIPGIEIAPPGRQADRSYDANGNRIR